MSLKDNISMVKEELNSEEKFFEKAVITEKFVKKYKNVMIGTIVVVVAVIGANIAYDINKQSQTTAANEAFAILNKDAKNASALSELKSLSPDLYDVWIYSQAVVNKDLATLKELKSSKALIVSDLASYELAVDSKDIDKLDSYASKQNAIYKDLALVQSAVILMSSSKIEEAHQKLAQVSATSSLNKIVSALLHYGVK